MHAGSCPGCQANVRRFLSWLSGKCTQVLVLRLPRYVDSPSDCQAKTGLIHVDSMLLYVHRHHEAYYGRGAQDGHFDFHAAPEL